MHWDLHTKSMGDGASGVIIYRIVIHIHDHIIVIGIPVIFNAYF